MNAYIESRKMVLMNFFSGLQWRWRHREQIYEHWGEGRDGESEKKRGGRNTGNRDGRKEARDTGRKGRGRVTLSPQGGF